MARPIATIKRAHLCIGTTHRSDPEPDVPAEPDVPTGFGDDSDTVVLSAAENRAGCGRYPFRVRTL